MIPQLSSEHLPRHGAADGCSQPVVIPPSRILCSWFSWSSRFPFIANTPAKLCKSHPKKYRNIWCFWVFCTTGEGVSYSQISSLDNFEWSCFVVGLELVSILLVEEGCLVFIYFHILLSYFIQFCWNLSIVGRWFLILGSQSPRIYKLYQSLIYWVSSEVPWFKCCSKSPNLPTNPQGTPQRPWEHSLRTTPLRTLDSSLAAGFTSKHGVENVEKRLIFLKKTRRICDSAQKNGIWTKR